VIGGFMISNDQIGQLIDRLDSYGFEDETVSTETSKAILLLLKDIRSLLNKKTKKTFKRPTDNPKDIITGVE
jgi:hypothetical protein